MQNVDDTITIEVKNRLDDLFGETADESLEFMDGKMQDVSPLKDLKAALLSLDWEITEEVINDFMRQVDQLKVKFKQDRLISLFLQLLGSIGKYVQVYKGRSHPQAFKLLNTAFNRMEEVITFPDLKEADKKRYLYGEIIKFKELREKIGLERTQSRTSGSEQTVRRTESAPAAKEKRAAKAARVRANLTETSVKGAMTPGAAHPKKSEPDDAPVFFEVAEERQGKTGRRKESEAVAPTPGPEKPSDGAFAPIFSRSRPPEGTPGPPETAVRTLEEILSAVQELKTIVREEFTSLRAQIRSLGRYR